MWLHNAVARVGMQRRGGALASRAGAATSETVTFFESLVALLAIAVLLLQITRRLSLPYPGVLAAAGVAVAMVPGAPTIPIDPHTALALFIAPVLIDAGFDFPLSTARRMIVPLTVFAVIAVLATTGVVMAVSALSIGLPIAAAVALGAIVAPPDAAAATAVLVNLPVGRRVETLLKGESLFNDALALLLFGAAVTVQQRGGLDSSTAIQLGAAVPGGVLLGIAYGYAVSWLRPLTGNTVGATILQFVQGFGLWLIADRLHLSPVLATVASAMTIAATVRVSDSPRMRVHSFAVWTTVVFLLNVLAFLLMGLQARLIVGRMSSAELATAGWFAAAVVAGVIATRLIVAFVYRLIIVRQRGDAPVSNAETLLIGWAGMRGLITLATAFALPASFPMRGTVVLTAFAVVLATLVIQGATLAPLIRLLGVERAKEAEAERDKAHVALVEAALARLADEPGDEAGELRQMYQRKALYDLDQAATRALNHHRGLALGVVLAQRKRLEELRDADEIGADRYLEIQEDLDWKQLSVIADEERRIAES